MNEWLAWVCLLSPLVGCLFYAFQHKAFGKMLFKLDFHLAEKCQRLIEIVHVQRDADDASENAESSVFEGDLAEHFQKLASINYLILR